MSDLRNLNFLNIAFHVRSKIMFCTIFKVKVEVTSTTSIVIMFRPGMAGLPATRRPKFHFKNVIFDPTFPNLLREIDVRL